MSNKPENGQEPDTADKGAAKARPGLTRPMLYTLVGVGAVVAIGLVVSLSLLVSGSAPTGADASATPAPTVTQGPSPSATPVDGSEVQAPETGATAAPDTGADGLPPIEAQTPLIAAPFPDSASADGSLVDGFPVDIMGPVAGSDILSSSIATEGGVMQVTLVGRSDGAPGDVAATLRQRWAALALSDADPSSADALSFSNPFTSLSLAFTPASSTGTVYMLFGVFRAS